MSLRHLVPPMAGEQPEAFVLHTFEDTINVADVYIMVGDSQYLAWRENDCQNGYVSLIVAMDCRRYRAMTDRLLLRL